MTPTPSGRPRSPHRQPLPTLAIYGLLAAALAGLVLPLAGSLLPETRTVSASARVEAGPAAVWATLARVEAYPDWRSGVDRVGPLPGTDRLRDGSPPAGPGAEPSGTRQPETGLPPEGWVEEGRLGPGVRYRVLAAEPPRRLALEVRQIAPPYRGRRVVRLIAEEAGTRIVVGQRGGVSNPVFRISDRYLAAEARDPQAFVRDLARRLGRR